MRPGHFIPVILISAAGLIACQESDPKGELSSASEALAAYAANNLWNTNGNVVNVCWVATGLATQKTQIQNAITSGWIASSGITFTWPANPGTDLCPTVAGQPTKVPSNYMPISLVNDGGYGGLCNEGVGGRNSTTVCMASMECECIIHYGYGGAHSDPTSFLSWGALHEIGHGLGLPHEHQRSDRPADIATTCVGGWSDDDQHTIDTTYRLLTPYDGNLSIMSYCRDFDQNGLPDDPPFTALSAFDQLGIEMLYPYSLGRRPVIPGAITTASDGSHALVRSDIAYTVNPDWIARGGLTSALSNFQWADQNLAVFSTNPSVSLSFPVSRTINLQLTDLLGRVHPFTPITVTVDNAAFTAVAQMSPTML